jgi:hypothetical protein
MDYYDPVIERQNINNPTFDLEKNYMCRKRPEHNLKVFDKKFRRVRDELCRYNLKRCCGKNLNIQ